MGPALHDLAGNACGISPVDALQTVVIFGSAAPVGAAAAGVIADGVPGVPVRRPLPDVADHVVQAVAVGRERADRRGPLVAVVLRVLNGELALPGVGHPAAVRIELISPGELGAVEPA